MRRMTAVLALAFGGLAWVSPAHAAPPAESDGCAAFGENLSNLAKLGSVFGGITSGTASQEGPGAIANVVESEQAALCE